MSILACYSTILMPCCDAVQIISCNIWLPYAYKDQSNIKTVDFLFSQERNSGEEDPYRETALKNIVNTRW